MIEDVFFQAYVKEWNRRRQWGLKRTHRFPLMRRSRALKVYEAMNEARWNAGFFVIYGEHERFFKECEAALDEATIPHKKPKIIEDLLERDGPECWICGKLLDSTVTIEHMVAVSLGGTNDRDNLKLAHASCNRRVGNMTLERKLKHIRKMKAKLREADD